MPIRSLTAEFTGRDATRPVDHARRSRFLAGAGPSLDRSYRLAGLLLGNSHEAEDAVQDALVTAWQGFDKLRDADRFGAWFDRILVNGCRDRLRGRARVRVIDIAQAAEPSAPDGSGPLAERGALRGALTHLPADQRIAIALRYYEDLSLAEIADRTGERLGTVKSRLHYGLESLRAAYGRVAIALDGIALTVPSINEPITDGEIQVSFGSLEPGLAWPDQVRELVAVLASGPLPSAVDVVHDEPSNSAPTSSPPSAPPTGEPTPPPATSSRVDFRAIVDGCRMTVETSRPESIEIHVEFGSSSCQVERNP